MNKFNGTFEELKKKVLHMGISGAWKECGTNGNQKQYKTETGIILNWWETSKTLQIQGPTGNNKNRFEELLYKSLNNELPTAENIETPHNSFVPSTSAKKIFIVHGHDDTALQQLELFLRRLDLEPYILKNAGGSGKTIIEALEQSILSESAFGIVLMTPDDIGCSQQEYQEDTTKLQPRARQNVILEMGILIGAIGRDKVAILRKGNIENPSDVSGILYISFNNSVIKEAGNSLIKHLKRAGIPIDEGKIITALS